MILPPHGGIMDASAAAWEDDTHRGISQTSEIQLEIGRQVAYGKGESRMKPRTHRRSSALPAEMRVNAQ